MGFLKVTSSPHMRHEDTTRIIMIDVLISLCPALIWAVYIFGARALVLTLVSIASAVLFEFLYRLITKKSVTIGDCSAAVTGIVSAIETGVNFLATVISGIGSLVQTVVGTLADILAAVLSIAQSVAVAIAAVFIPSPGYFDAKVEALKGAFPFFNSAMDTAFQLKNFLINLGSTPPIIYIDLAAGSGWYPMGGRTVFVDLTWYSAYKPTMDAVISAFLWLWFTWRLVLSLPGIIQGTSGFWGQPIAMNPNGYIPSRGTVNETGLTIRK